MFRSTKCSLKSILFGVIIANITGMVFAFITVCAIRHLKHHVLVLLKTKKLTNVCLVLNAYCFFRIDKFFVIILIILTVTYCTVSLKPVA